MEIRKYFTLDGIPVMHEGDARAALAAKDAQIAELRRDLERTTNQLAWTRARRTEIETAYDQLVKLYPSVHPDTARLDKLPQCFHMLRTNPGSKGDRMWWLSTDPNKTFETVREAIDAHQPIPGIDQGQFLAACEAGNRVFGEGGTFGGTPE